ncbi:MAG TPA: glycosyltransferase family A protein [Gemmatimonadales bacterium]|nr:glycosyltransferase family A protein [Gemmatimonadales bacterium]
MPDALVSIIIPAFVATPRQADLLAETLDTVAGQSCQEFEVLVVDDGSPREVKHIAGTRKRTTVIRQANAGSAIARNTGIAASRGRFLVFLDADDHLLAPALEAGLRGFAEHAECGFVVGGREEMTYEGAPVPWSVPAMPRESRLYNILLGFDWYIIPPSSVMFRREVIEATGGFRDPWGADDLDLYLRVARRAFGWCSESPAVTRYRRYSASSSRDGERMLRSIRVVYDRQREVVRGDPEGEAAFHRGLERLTAIFTDCLVENVEDRLRDGQWGRAARSAVLLGRESPRRLAQVAGKALRGAGPRSGAGPV